MNDIDTVRVQFAGSVERFLHKVEARALGQDPASMRDAKKDYGELAIIWSQPNIAPLEQLVQINDVTRLIARIIEFTETVDVARIATELNVSDTLRGTMMHLQRDILDFGSALLSLYGAQTNALLKKALDIAQIESLLRARIANHEPLGSVFSKIARRYAPLMSASARDAMRAALLSDAINVLLEVERVPIDNSRPIYEQVLTSGALLPLTQSMSRTAFFAMCDSKYKMQRDISENFARLARKLRANLIYVSKVARFGTANAIEFDARSLFDFAYVKKNDLVVPKFSGLCDKFMQRYNTVRLLSESKAVVPNYLYCATPGATHTLVIESLVGNLFRVIGRATSDPTDFVRFLTENESCRFLVEGQSTRADQYNRRAEDAIFSSRARTAEVRDIVHIYKTTSADTLLSDSLRNHIAIKLREYALAKMQTSMDVLSDVFKLCIDALHEVLPVQRAQIVDVGSRAYFFAKLSRIAAKITSLIARYPIIDRARIDQIIERIVGEVADEELFALDETLNMTYLRRKTK